MRRRHDGVVPGPLVGGLPPAIVVAVALLGGCAAPGDGGGTGSTPVPTATLAVGDVRDRIAGGWVGQLVGVAAAGITEFLYLGEIIPEEMVPEWSPEFFETAWLQDDVYVEVPFLEAFAAHGPTVGWKELGDAFAASEFPLWHANGAARTNLRSGIPAPDSGHWRNNPHADDIDWQIEADFVGLVAPGMPREAVEMAWRTGHVMNYGDGVYGGVWVAAMHAEAFVAADVRQIVDAGLAAVPQGSLFRRVLDDVVAAHEADPADWTKAWHAVQVRWRETDRCPDGAGRPYNIDAKLNAAYVLMGLLYGGGDFDRSIRIAMRGGDDSDCNPSTVGGILGNWLGLSRLPARYRDALDWDRKFVFTEASLTTCVEKTEAVAREVLRLAGGRVSGSGDAESWEVPRRPVSAPILEQWPADADEPPTLDARVDSVSGLVATFVASATDPDGIAAYAWTFGDLAFASGPSATHEYPWPGTWRATAWVADANGNTSLRSVDVVVPGP
ncbi:MAG: ADP-ribosylglycohydrolase family protein [Deltaproteobacteria bacterium]|nr:ADP-ribosylglycohydrolase family protein [Deltaproteobacteria bacterium]